MANGPTHTRVVGPWVLEQQIGSGSFATVWRARHNVDNTLAAVKEINTEKLSKKLQESLACEISVLEQIQHGNVVRLLDITKVSYTIFIVLEYCAGGDMGQFLRRKGRVTEPVARHFLQQLANGLKEIRRHNLIHRDLKPQNLLLSETGQGAVLKIADFGFARPLAPQGLAETLCGSPLYMAPEILQYHKYDAKADLWSVGAILFELVTGRTPYTGINHVQLLRNIERYDVQIPDVVASQLSPSCKQLILDLLKRNPVERISFEEFFTHPFLLEGPSYPPGASPTDPTPTPADNPATADKSVGQVGQPPASPTKQQLSAQRQDKPEPAGLTPALAALASRPPFAPQPRIPTTPSLPVSTPASDRNRAGSQLEAAAQKDVSLSDSIEDEYVVVDNPTEQTCGAGIGNHRAMDSRARIPVTHTDTDPPSFPQRPSGHHQPPSRHRPFEGHARPPRPDLSAAPKPTSSTALVCSNSGAPAQQSIDMPALLQRVLATLQQLVDDRRESGAVREAVALLLLSVGVLEILAGMCPPMTNSSAPAVAVRMSIGKHAKVLQSSLAALQASGAPIGAQDPLPNSIELVYQAALLQCRAGGAEELMTNFAVGGAAYARAADLLLFLALHFLELAAHPRAHTEALVACHHHVHKLCVLASTRRDTCAMYSMMAAQAKAEGHRML